MSDPFDAIQKNQIVIEEARKKFICSACRGKLFKKDVIATNAQNPTLQKQKYHLHCFQPLFYTTIQEGHHIKILLSETPSRNQVTNWIKNWNWSVNSTQKGNIEKKISRRAIPKDANKPRVQQFYFPKLGKQDSMLILLFLTTDEIEFIIKFINKSFYEICWSSQLWKRLYCRDFTKAETSNKKKLNSKRDWYEEYLLLEKISCYVCKKKIGGVLEICPIEKKPLCQTCRQKSDFNLLTLAAIKRNYGDVLWYIFSNYIEKYAEDIPGDKVFYQKDVESAYQSYKNFSL